MRVFISYSSSDRFLVQGIVETLEAAGLHCYMAERDIRAGRHISRKVMKELDNSEVVALFLSRASLASSWVQQEIGYAKSRLPIVPVKLDDTKPSALIEGVEAVPLEHALEHLGDVLRESVEEFANAAKATREDDPDDDDDDICEPGPHEVEPGGYVALPMDVEAGDRYEGLIQEEADESFTWEVLDLANYLLFKKREEYFVIAGEADVAVGDVKFKIPRNRRGPWFLLLTAARKQNVRILKVALWPRG